MFCQRGFAWVFSVRWVRLVLAGQPCKKRNQVLKIEYNSPPFTLPGDDGPPKPGVGASVSNGPEEPMSAHTCHLGVPNNLKLSWLQKNGEADDIIPISQMQKLRLGESKASILGTLKP